MAETKGDHAVKGNLSVSGDVEIAGGLDSPYLEVVDQKAHGIAGGGFTEGQWRTRDLTTTQADDFATSITLAANPGEGGNIILPAGIYYINAITPAFGVDSHQARLADVTDNPGNEAATVVLGTSEYCSSDSVEGDYVQTASKVTGRFTLARATTLEVQHRCQTTQAANGLGYAAKFYITSNQYTSLKMWQLST